MENIILTDPMIKPDEVVLGEVLGKKYKLFQEFVGKLNEQKLVLEWNYYKDQKAWLCKVLNKKKNLAWLSVWDTGFKLTFFFTEKTIDGFFALEINDEIKELARDAKKAGKLIPVVFLVKSKEKMKDGVKILEYKKCFT